MGQCILNVRFRGRDNKIVRAVYSRDGEDWFEDQACTIPIDPRTAKTAGTLDDVLFFAIPVFVLVIIALAVIKFVPKESNAQTARKQIKALENVRRIQDMMLDVYIQQLSKQTNE